MVHGMGGDLKAFIHIGQFVQREFARVINPLELVSSVHLSTGLLMQSRVQIEGCLRIVFAEKFDEAQIVQYAVVPALSHFYHFSILLFHLIINMDFREGAPVIFSEPVRFVPAPLR